jgi:hypothetical protein
MDVASLKAFCSTDDFRFYLHNPWTRDGFTYACDGCIAVRIPAIEAVADNKDAPNIAVIFQRLSPGPYVSAPAIPIPPQVKTTCPDCDGEPHGIHKNCDSCTCVCEGCGGAGITTRKNSVGLEGFVADAKYLRLMWALPGLQVGPRPGEDCTWSFKFDGGDGLLIGMRSAWNAHLIIPFPPFVSIDDDRAAQIRHGVG